MEREGTGLTSNLGMESKGGTSCIKGEGKTATYLWEGGRSQGLGL